MLKVSFALAVWLAVTAVGLPSGTAAADAGSPWIAGRNAVGEDTFVGFIDAPLSGSSVLSNSPLEVRGWVVDRTAVGWTGIDDVQIYLGLQDQGGTLLARAAIGQRRDDVVAVFGNGYWSASGFSASFTNNGLGVGSNLLSVYAHTPDKGWWYKQVEVRIAPLPALPHADDPLLVVNELVPGTDVSHTLSNLILRGYAIDRNPPIDVVVGVGGSGVSTVQFYLDGPRNGGTFLGSAQLGLKRRDVTGFGERFLQSGWEMTVHPTDFTVDKHALFIYAISAYWPNETLVIVPFTIH